MMAKLRIAVWQFEPFERAIGRRFDDFAQASGCGASLEIEAFDLNGLPDALSAKRALGRGEFDIAFLSTGWIAALQ
jgi:multiple sugar transport system substrate-binding protein